MYTATSHLRRCVLFVALLSAGGCDSSGNDSVAGTYAASRFTVGGVDVLDAEGSLQMTLRDDGSVTGRLTVPESLAEGEETDYDLAGTYSVSGDRVAFTQAADTFVRDAAWTYGDGELRGAFGDVVIVLTRE